MNSETEVKPHKRRCMGRGRFLFFIPVIAVMILAKSAVFMLLWNALIPDLFHGPLLSYPQALGLMVLVKLLAGFGFRGHGHHRGFGKFKRMRDRFEFEKHFRADMTEEEREKLREELHRRWHR